MRLTAADTQEHKRTASDRRGLTCMMALVILLLGFSLVTVVVVIIYRPGLFGLALNGDVTATFVSLQRTLEGVEQRSSVLQATAEYNATQSVNVNSTSAAFVAVEFNNEGTRVALENYEMQVYSGATQAARDVVATQTSIALSNAQQATQSALEFAATQAAFDRIATQVELEYQGTQAALSSQATAAVLGFATQAPPAEDVLTQTPTPTITAVPLFTDGFAGGVQAGLWQFGAAADWRLNENDVLAATRSGAWMLTQLDQLDGYVFSVDLLPLVGQALAADYFILLNIPRTPDASGGMTLRMTYDGERLIAAGLYAVTRADITDDVGLLDSISRMQAIRTVQLDLPTTDALNIRVEQREAQLQASVNGSTILDVTLENVPPAGAVGLQVPVSTQVGAVTLAP